MEVVDFSCLIRGCGFLPSQQGSCPIGNTFRFFLIRPLGLVLGCGWCSKSPDGEIYYFNFTSGDSVWDHPCDEYYKYQPRPALCTLLLPIPFRFIC